VIRAALALAALAAATVALTQQTTPPAEPQASTAPQDQTAPPADSSARMSVDKQTLMRDCMRQVQAANPSVPEKDVKAYCDKQVKSYAPQ
jgi:hypothetical protein